MTGSAPPEPDSPPSSDTVQRAVERAEAAATRRRWVTLAEVVGVAGLLIAALSLWMNWSDRRADDQERQAERASEAKARTLVMLTADVEQGGGRLALKDNVHSLQSIDIRFPKAMGVAQQTSVLEPRIDAEWIAPAILALTDGGPDAREGRVPALITARYWDGDKQRADSAIYDIVWATEGRILRGRALRLKGMVLRERSTSASRLDAIWAKEKPHPKR